MTFGASDLTVDFGGLRALESVDLEVPAGSVTSVVGGDGAGKSTLLRALVGRCLPTAGEVRAPSRERIGYMPSTSGTWRDMTVQENIDFVGESYGMSKQSRRRRADELLQRASLASATGRLAGALSGGMRQKLGFVLAMLHEPELLVLDEPSTGVDPVSRVELWRLISTAAANGTAVAMATTYIDEAERTARIAILDRGRVVAEGTREALVAGCPGHLTSPAQPEDPETFWQRAGATRQWHPSPPEDSPVRRSVALDWSEVAFEDVVIANLLADRAARRPAERTETT